MKAQSSPIISRSLKPADLFSQSGLLPEVVPTKGFEFLPDPLAHLSAHDQFKFEMYGQGPVVNLPFDCIHHAFEAQVLMQPHAVAAKHLDKSITYQQLDQQAARVAAVLAQHGVRSGDHVALFLQRSIPMLVGILATLKLGAAYVPQHVGVAPEDQLRHIIKTANTRIILTLAELKHLIPTPTGHQCIAIDEVISQPNSNQQNNVAVFTRRAKISPDQTCFVLFTSGTTGKPNGVRVTHKNVCNILLTHPGNLGIKAGMTVAQILNIAFDMAAWEIFGCLSHGATMLIRGKSIQTAAECSDVVIATPTVLGSLDVQRCRNVQVVAVAGEPCPRPLADTWSDFATFYNACGPTETTIINTAQNYTSQCERLTIGKPTPNNTVYVLDKNKKACAIGEVGEMWAGGDCVTAGYLKNPALNNERYAADPFLGGARVMFRTRDLGRWTTDGELEHFGRVDDQVKVRGFRVELDSVSSVMESAAECSQAVTLKLDDKNLVGFVCPQSVDTVKITKLVGSALPYYCVPSLIITLPELPMTSRGKVDKRVLLDIAKRRQAELEPHATQQMTTGGVVSC